jgi:hypothetical protein
VNVVDTPASVVGHLTRRLPADATPADTAALLLERARSFEDLAARSDDPDLAGRASAWAVEARWAASELPGGDS